MWGGGRPGRGAEACRAEEGRADVAEAGRDEGRRRARMRGGGRPGCGAEAGRDEGRGHSGQL